MTLLLVQSSSPVVVPPPMATVVQPASATWRTGGAAVVAAPEVLDGDENTFVELFDFTQQYVRVQFDQDIDTLVVTAENLSHSTTKILSYNAQVSPDIRGDFPTKQTIRYTVPLATELMQIFSSPSGTGGSFRVYLCYGEVGP